MSDWAIVALVVVMVYAGLILLWFLIALGMALVLEWKDRRDRDGE